MCKQTAGHERSISTGNSLGLILTLIVPLCIYSQSRPAEALAPDKSIIKSAQQQSAPEQNTQESAVLAPGKPVERELPAGQKHVYQIALSQGHYVKIEIKQPDIEIFGTLRMPSGEPLPWTFDGPIFQQEWNFGHVAERTGLYLLAIAAKGKTTTGRYEIKIAELRPATENDNLYHLSRSLFLEYWRLQRQGKYLEARPILLRILEIRERVLGPDDLYIVTVLGYLAVNYSNTGDYASAEPLRLRQLRITEKALGPDHPAVGNVLNGLGSLYLSKGDYQKAEEIDLRALAIFEKARRGDTFEVVSLSSALGGIYYDRGDYANAEKYYQRSRAVLEKLFGPDHFHLASSVTTLGKVAYDAGDLTKAETMFRQALVLSEKGLGADHLGVTSYRNNLAMVNVALGNYEKAEEHYRQTLSIHERKGAMSQPVVQEALFGLAALFIARGAPSEAVKFQTWANELEEGYVGLNLGVGSEREKLAFLDKLSARASRNISLHLDFVPTDVSARTLAINTVLQRKGRVQDAMSDGLAALRLRLAPENQQLLDRLNETTSKLAKLVLDGPQKRTAPEHQQAVTALEKQRESLEGEVSRHSAGYFEPSRTPTVAAVQAVIPDQAALIEFVVYSPIESNGRISRKLFGETRYAVYVLRHRDPPQGKDLGSTKDIDFLIHKLRQALRDPLRQDVRQLARALDEKVMRPVRELVGTASQLIVSPDGALNLIPFQALINEQQRYLIERYSFAYVTSGRDLLRMQVARNSKNPPLAIADPLFSEPSAQLPAPRNMMIKAERVGRMTEARDLSEIYFAPLNGTADEAQMIRKFFPEMDLLTGAEATESALKKVSGPRVLHVATHGFFLQDTLSPSLNSVMAARRASVKIENPLLRSGLALAGANLPGSGPDDGILTALEASGLNLWGTKLVVLSACDTGLGEVRNGEGVYGLRRAFVLAGAEALVMSLWPVSDYPTKRLMTEFYKNLKQGIGRGEALRKAQLGLLNDKLHPFYWANFIQSGEWASLDGRRNDPQTHTKKH